MVNNSLESIKDLPQVECPVNHYFRDGEYIRECTIPKGSIVVGHHHKKECLNIFLSGEIALVENGEAVILKAPMFFNSGPGRKMAYAITDVVWQNVHKTEETDLEKIEQEFIDKDKDFKEFEEHLRILKSSKKLTEVAA